MDRRVLIAEDDPVSCRLVQGLLNRWGHEVVTVPNGAEALRVLSMAGSPRLAILDWMMPELDGLEVCRRLRAAPRRDPVYLILLTARTGMANLVAALDGGADDYLTKPFHPDELRARLNVGQRVVELQQALADRILDLETALARVKQLQGLLPICSYCKKVRDDQNYWQQVDDYLGKHTDARLTHGICPDCFATVVQPQLDGLAREPGR